MASNLKFKVGDIICNKKYPGLLLEIININCYLDGCYYTVRLLKELFEVPFRQEQAETEYELVANEEAITLKLLYDK